MMQHLVLPDWPHLLLLLLLFHLLLVMLKAGWAASLQVHSALKQQTCHLPQPPAAAAAAAAAETQTADA
jgi:hypothetical protein